MRLQHSYRPVDGFVLSLPEGRSINTVTGGDLEGVSVKPEIIVPAEVALGRARSLARKP